MNCKILLEFTCNGHKHTFFKRLDTYDNPVVTYNKINARPIKENDLKLIVAKLQSFFGENNIKNINPIKLQ